MCKRNGKSVPESPRRVEGGGEGPAQQVAPFTVKVTRRGFRATGCILTTASRIHTRTHVNTFAAAYEREA